MSSSYRLSNANIVIQHIITITNFIGSDKQINELIFKKKTAIDSE